MEKDIRGININEVTKGIRKQIIKELKEKGCGQQYYSGKRYLCGKGKLCPSCSNNSSNALLKDKEPESIVETPRHKTESGSPFNLSDKIYGPKMREFILAMDVKEFIKKLKKDTRENIREACAYQLIHKKKNEETLDLLVDWLCHKIDKLAGKDLI